MNIQSRLTVGIAILVLASPAVIGAGAATSGGTTAAVQDASANVAQNGNQTGQNGNQTGELERTVNVSELEVSALEAAQLAANETGGKPVAVKLATENGTPVFGVLTVNQSGNVTGVVVDATNGQVVRTADNIGFLNMTVLQDQGGVSGVADLRSAVEAIQAAQGVAPSGAVPIEVAIEAERGLLLQQVTFAQPANGQNNLTRVVVDATAGPVVGVIPADEGVGGVPNETEPGGNETGTPGTPTETPGTETDAGGNQTDSAGTETTANEQSSVNALAYTSSESASNVQFGEDEDEGVYGDEVFAEDDEFDAGDDYGVVGFNEGYGGAEEEEEGGFFGGGEEDENGDDLLF